MGRKIDSLNFLRSKGFNTVDFLVFDNLKKFEKAFTGLGWVHVSIRSDTKTSEELPFGKLPFYTNQDFLNATMHVKEILDQGLLAMVYPAINPDDSEVAGRLGITSYGGEHLEFFFGPGTIRDMDDRSDKQFMILPLSGGVPDSTICPELVDFFPIIQQMRKQVKDLDERPMLLEWSIYPYLLGWKKQRLIFWERRNYL